MTCMKELRNLNWELLLNANLDSTESANYLAKQKAKPRPAGCTAL